MCHPCPSLLARLYFHALNQTVARGGNPYASPSLLRLASSSVGLELFFNSCSSSRNVTREGCPCCIVALRFSSLNLASPSSKCCTRFISEVLPAPHGALIPMVSGGTVSLCVIRLAIVRAYASYPNRSSSLQRSDATFGVGFASDGES